MFNAMKNKVVYTSAKWHSLNFKLAYSTSFEMRPLYTLTLSIITVIQRHLQIQNIYTLTLSIITVIQRHLQIQNIYTLTLSIITVIQRHLQIQNIYTLTLSIITVIQRHLQIQNTRKYNTDGLCCSGANAFINFLTSAHSNTRRETQFLRC